MKKKVALILLTAIICCIFLCAFTIDPHSSVKALTKPYITTYDCTYARLGNEDLLEKYDYFKVTFLDDEKLEISFKRNDRPKRSYICPYTYDEKTCNLNAEFGIFGFKFKQDTVIKKGRFNVKTTLLGKPLVMRFSAE